jgi:hypothetical protein
MTLAKETVILGVDDAKISPISVDDSSALTYDAAIDVPGITSIKLTPNFVEKELRGDESILDQYSKLESIDWSFENSIMSLDVLAVLIGGTVTANGVTPNQSQTYKLNKADKPKYFKLEGKSDYTDMGDAHVVLYKCKASKAEYSFVGEDYAKVSASGKAIGTKYNGDIKDLVFNETAVDITTGSAPGALTVTTSPADGGASVAVDSNITWTFSNAISPSDVSAANFTVTKSDGTAVDGTLSIDSTKKIVSFDPTSNLDASSTYIAIATIGVHDIYGQTLAANSVIDFGTA